MSEAERSEQVAAATAYEELHVPALFGQWTGPVLDAARVGAGDRVLDVACGTGVLAPGGRLAVAVWESLERSPAYSEEVALLERVAGRAAADALRAPFELGDRAQLLELFQRAGAADVRVETGSGTARFPSVRTMVEADLRGWLPVMGVELEEHAIERVLAEAEDALRAYVVEGGRVEFRAPAHVVSARSA